jgi:hypothetical protein
MSVSIKNVMKLDLRIELDRKARKDCSGREMENRSGRKRKRKPKIKDR